MSTVLTLLSVLARRLGGERRARLVTLLLLAQWVTGAPAASAADDSFRILAVMSDEAAYYEEVIAAFRAQLQDYCTPLCAADPELLAVNLADLSNEEARRSDLLIPLGRAASLVVARAAVDVPTVYALIPGATWRELQTCCPAGPRQTTAVLIDQPLARQLELIRTAIPGASRIGVLTGPTSAALMAGANHAAAPVGMTIVTESVASNVELGPALRSLLKRSEALLAVPDPVVFNRDTIVSVLLTTYRERVPLVGYSQAMVRAGAVLALFSTPDDIGRQLGDLSERVLSGQPLPAPAAADYYHVEVNREVARSLGLELPDERDLVRALEGRR